jgi:hypothetical protein
MDTNIAYTTEKYQTLIGATDYAGSEMDTIINPWNAVK